MKVVINKEKKRESYLLEDVDDGVAFMEVVKELIVKGVKG